MSDQTLMFDLLAKDSVSSKFSDISRSAMAASGEMRAAFDKPIDVKIETEGFDTYMAKLEAVKAMNAGAIQDIHAKSTGLLLEMTKAERGLDDMAAMSDAELSRWASGGLADVGRQADKATHSLRGMRTATIGLGFALGAPALGGGVAILGGLAGILATGAAAAAPFLLAVKGVVGQFQSQQKAIVAVQGRLAGLTDGSKHYRAVLEHLHHLQHQFGAQFGPMRRGMDKLKHAWDGFVTAARPMVVQAIGMALKVAVDVLRKMVPVVKAVGPAFIQLMGDMDNFIKSPGFRRFIRFLEAEGPGAILAIGHAIGKIGGAIMAVIPHLAGLMHWLGNLSGGKLAAIIGGIGALAAAIALLGGGPIAAVAAIAALGTALVIAYHKVAPFRKAVQGIWADIQAKLMPILHQVEAWFRKEWPTIQKLGAQVLHALAGAFKSFVNLVSALWQRFGHQILDHAKNAIEGVLKIFKGVFQIIGGVMQAFADLLTGKWSHLGADLKQIARGAWNIVKGIFQAALGNIVDAVRSHGSQIAGFFKSLPGRILGALGNLGGLLVHAGESVISGLAQGIWNATVGKLAGVLSSVTGFIKAHKGPIEVDRVLLVPAGEAIMQGLIDGMNAKKGQLQTVLQQITGMVSKAGQQLQADMQARASFQQGFVSTYASSPFTATSAQGSPITGAGGLIGQQKSALEQALRLRHDTRKLISEGLSKSLLNQLAAAGPSGLEQIHALASGSLAQVHRLNRLDRRTNATLGQAAHIAGNDLYGAKIARDKENLAAAKVMADEVRKAIKGEKIGDHVHQAMKHGFTEAQIHHMTRLGTKEGAEIGAEKGVATLGPRLDRIEQAIANQAQQTLTKSRQHGGSRKKGH